MIRVGAIDCSLNNLGLALLHVDPDTLAIEVADLSLVTTEPQSGKQVRRNSDDLRRGRELLGSIQGYEARCDLMMAEVPMGTQSARGAMSNGIVIGVLAGVVRPLIQVSPTEAKKAAIGRATATKAEIIDWASGLYPDAPWLRRKHKGAMRLIDANEHLADAVAIAHAGVRTPEFRAAVAMMNSLRRAA